VFAAAFAGTACTTKCSPVPRSGGAHSTCNTRCE
jgi:hypothetical protein